MTEGQARGGLFVTFEGGDGSGKSTQMRLVAERLEGLGFPTRITAEPGGTRIGTAIRRILLDPEHRELAPRTEVLLYFACRAQNVEEWILPALAQGKIVLSDRFTDSTLAYQGVARGLGADVVEWLDRYACQGLKPDVTFVFEVDVATGLERVRQGAVDRIEGEERAFHEKVLRAYRELASSEPARVHLVDARRSIEAVAAEVWLALEPWLEKLRR